MAKVYDSILDLVGKTPLVELKRIEEKEGLQAKLIANCLLYTSDAADEL